jgi:hypothetical protein
VQPSARQGVLDLAGDDTFDHDQERARRSAVENAMDEVRARFGAGAVAAGSLIGTGRAAREGE